MGQNAIEGGRWDNLLRRFFTIKERGVAPEIASEIVPYFPVEAGDNPTFHFLRNERLGGATEQVAAVAAQFSSVELTNPPNSGTLVTVTSVELWSSVLGSLQIRLGVHDGLGAPGTIVLRDLRWLRGNVANIQRLTARVFRNNNAAHFGTLLGEARAIANTVIRYPEPIVLPPGFSVFGEQATVNTLVNGQFTWTERPIEPGEL